MYSGRLYTDSVHGSWSRIKFTNVSVVLPSWSAFMHASNSNMGCSSLFVADKVLQTKDKLLLIEGESE